MNFPKYKEKIEMKVMKNVVNTHPDDDFEPYRTAIKNLTKEEKQSLKDFQGFLIPTHLAEGFNETHDRVRKRVINEHLARLKTLSK